jgi:hypothetical protein
MTVPLFPDEVYESSNITRSFLETKGEGIEACCQQSWPQETHTDHFENKTRDKNCEEAHKE